LKYAAALCCVTSGLPVFTLRRTRSWLTARHLVVGAEHRADLGVRLEDVRQCADRLLAVEVRRDLPDDPDAAALHARLDAIDAVGVDLRSRDPRMIASVPRAVTLRR
jgi:hypothetical protein